MTSNEKKIQEIPLKGDDEEPVQLDEVLSKLGAFGRHQLITMCMLALVYATNSIYNVNYVFAVEDVNYRYFVSQFFYLDLINLEDIFFLKIQVQNTRMRFKRFIIRGSLAQHIVFRPGNRRLEAVSSTHTPEQSMSQLQHEPDRKMHRLGL